MAKAIVPGPSIGSLGVFTFIAHRTAWIVALLGSIGGGLVAVISLLDADGLSFLIGLAAALLSWTGAAGLGTLAEISIKLNKLGGE